MRDGVRLLGARLVAQGHGRPALELADGGEMLADAAAHLEAVGVVVDDEPIGGVENLLV